MSEMVLAISVPFLTFGIVMLIIYILHIIEMREIRKGDEE